MNVIPPDGDRAQPGMDHDWYEFSPIVNRPRPPSDMPPLSVSVLIDLTAVEWEAPGREPVVQPPGGRGPAVFPDYPRMSHREYGHRTGIFRLLDVLESADIPPVVIIDALTVTHYPSLVSHLRDRVAEFVAGGLSASRPITSRMGDADERAYVATSLAYLEAELGARPAGWTSPQGSESARTPGILAEHGFGFTTDWVNDEQPYPFRGTGQALWAYPVSWELSDLNALVLRQVPDAVFAESIKDAARVLLADGRTQPRVLGLHLHPWISGQPHLADLLVDALGQVVAMDGVRAAKPSQVLADFRRVCPELDGTRETDTTTHTYPDGDSP
jgi:allantoinase